MAVKLVLNSEQVLNKVFQGSTPGYNPLEVDEFLDKVLKDYHTVEENALLYAREYKDMKEKMSELSAENKRLNLENIKLKSRFQNIKQSDYVTTDNMDLIMRINVLEQFLYDHGFDPTKVK